MPVRPSNFNEVIGQDKVVNFLKEKVDKHSAFLLHGPSGVGKTTLARISAAHLGATEMDVFEFDAASHSGVEDMRSLVERSHSRPMGDARIYIIDECHRLSKNAWDVLLKPLEDSNDFNYWFLCTTEVSKVPRTIRTRCKDLKLSPISIQNLEDLLVKHFPNDDKYFLRECAAASSGSARQALNFAEQGFIPDAKDIQSPSGYELARLLVNTQWQIEEAAKLLSEMKEESPEGIRQTVRAYFTTVVLKNMKNRYALGVLQEFEAPCIEQNRISDIILRVARINKWRS